jgi:hypothetical protein
VLFSGSTANKNVKLANTVRLQSRCATACGGKWTFRWLNKEQGMFHRRFLTMLLCSLGVVVLAAPEAAARPKLRRHRFLCQCQAQSAVKAPSEVEQVLQKLRPHFPGTTDDQIQVEGLVAITSLILNFIAISDAGLQRMEVYSNLESLNLRGTHVTDAGLVHLKGLSRLRTLDLTETKVTDAGVKKLQQAPAR